MIPVATSILLYLALGLCGIVGDTDLKMAVSEFQPQVGTF